MIAMLTRILVGADGFDHARRENVLPAEPDLLQIRGEQALTRASGSVLNAGMPAPEIRLQYGDPATRIAQYATDHRIDLIVIGQRGLGSLMGLMLGSVSQRVAQLASCACLMVK
jgi:nucleotide-binding universal stress UspA family protein